MAKQNTKKRKVTFSFASPTAQSVQIAGDFTRWADAPVALTKNQAGLWTAALSLAPGRYEYRVLVDGQWCDDPECKIRQPNSLGGENCVLVV